MYTAHAHISDRAVSRSIANWCMGTRSFTGTNATVDRLRLVSVAYTAHNGCYGDVKHSALKYLSSESLFSMFEFLHLCLPTALMRWCRTCKLHIDACTR